MVNIFNMFKSQKSPDNALTDSDKSVKLHKKSSDVLDTIDQIIELANKNKVSKVKFKVDETLGVSLDSEISELPTKFSLGKSTHYDIEIDF